MIIVRHLGFTSVVLIEAPICRLVRLPPPPPSPLLGPDLLLAARGVTSTPAPGGGSQHLLQHEVGSITTDPNINHSCIKILHTSARYNVACYVVLCVSDCTNVDNVCMCGACLKYPTQFLPQPTPSPWRTKH